MEIYFAIFICNGKQGVLTYPLTMSEYTTQRKKGCVQLDFEISQYDRLKLKEQLYAYSEPVDVDLKLNIALMKTIFPLCWSKVDLELVVFDRKMVKKSKMLITKQLLYS